MDKIEQALGVFEMLRDEFGRLPHSLGYEFTHLPKADAAIATLRAELAGMKADAERLDYIERTFSGMTNRERYLPVRMIWGKGCNGRTLREACDKYIARDRAQEVG